MNQLLKDVSWIVCLNIFFHLEVIARCVEREIQMKGHGDAYHTQLPQVGTLH